MRLGYIRGSLHESGLNYNPDRSHEITLYTLWQLHSNEENCEMKCILGYLAYWRESKK